jgi:hypothetical protein
MDHVIIKGLKINVLTFPGFLVVIYDIESLVFVFIYLRPQIVIPYQQELFWILHIRRIIGDYSAYKCRNYNACALDSFPEGTICP